MAAYPGMTGANSIGTLLRLIQEQKSESPIIPAATETGTPMREMVQTPLEGAEAPGSAKMVSLRPEEVLPGGVQEEAVTPARSAIGPISIGGGNINVPRGQVQSNNMNVNQPNPPGQQNKQQGQVLGQTTGPTPTAADRVLAQAQGLVSQNRTNQQALQQMDTRITQGMNSAMEGINTANQASQPTQNNLMSRVIAAALKPTPTPTPAPTQPTSPYATRIWVNNRWMTWNPATRTYR